MRSRARRRCSAPRRITGWRCAGRDRDRAAVHCRRGRRRAARVDASGNRPCVLARRGGGGSERASRPRPGPCRKRAAGEVHLLVHAINSALGAFGATIGLIEPVAISPLPAPQSLAELVADMDGRQGRHAADARHEPGLQRARRYRFRGARWRGCRSRSAWRFIADETAQASTGTSRNLTNTRAWSDARAFDGIVDDPAAADLAALRRPFGARGACCSAGQHQPDDQALVREYWQGLERNSGAAAISSRSGMRRCAAESCRTPRAATAGPAARDLASAAGPPPEPVSRGLKLLFRPDDDHLGRPLRRQCLAAGAAAPVHAADLGQRRADRAGNRRPARRSKPGMSVRSVPRRPSVRRRFWCCRARPTIASRCRSGSAGAHGGLGGRRRLRRVSAARRRRDPWLGAGDAFSKTGEQLCARRGCRHDRDRRARDLVREGTLAGFSKNPQFR